MGRTSGCKLTEDDIELLYQGKPILINIPPDTSELYVTLVKPAETIWDAMDEVFSKLDRLLHRR